MKRYNKTSLFLMELIIAILFFALASAICIQVFAKAHTMNNDNLRLTHATMAASNIAETYRSQKLEEYYKADKDGYIYFDEQWNVVSNHSDYKALLVEKANTLVICILYQDQELYRINCQSYQQRTVKDGVVL
ncbi:MAG: hypothetical protein RR630_01210 [Coprobacillus sp.]